MTKFKIMSKPSEIFESMLHDIKNAKKSIYLETYIYGNDKIGNLFKKALEEKVKQGVSVYILIDALGSGLIRSRVYKLLRIKEKIGSWIDINFFNNLKKLGGKIRFFKEVRYALRMLSANH